MFREKNLQILKRNNDHQPLSFVFKKVELSQEVGDFPFESRNYCLSLLKVSENPATTKSTWFNFTFSLFSFSFSLSPSSRF